MGDGIDGLGTESYLWRENAWMRKEIERLREENEAQAIRLAIYEEDFTDVSARHRRIEEAARAALYTDPEDARGYHRALEAVLGEEA